MAFRPRVYANNYFLKHYKNRAHHNAKSENDVSNSFLSICMIFIKIILDMFSYENSIYCHTMWQFDIKKTEILRNPSFLLQIIGEYKHNILRFS